MEPYRSLFMRKVVPKDAPAAPAIAGEVQKLWVAQKLWVWGG